MAFSFHPNRRIVMTLLALLALLVAGTPALSRPAQAQSDTIVISQVYGGGGNSGATYTHDFIELFNRGTTTVSLDGWSLQYASATGTGNFGANSAQLTELSGTLAPGQYLLVQEGQGSGGTTPLPSPDIIDSTPIAMSGTAGKVALVSSTASLGCNGGSNPCSSDQLALIVDLVGYGNANFFEGSAAAPTTTNSTGVMRNGGGCIDTDDNGADFTEAAPEPRNRLSPLNPCQGDAPPSVVTVSPEDGAGDVTLESNITFTFSEAVIFLGTAFEINCQVSGLHTFTLTGGPLDFTLDPDIDFVPSEACTVTVFAAQVSDQDADDPPDNMAADFSSTFTTVALPEFCGDPATFIHDIQGNGLESPMNGATNVSIEGVVVGDFQGTGQFGGFYVQEEASDFDDDPATSEGIFVFSPSTPVSEGDIVRVRGDVTEFFSSGSTLTELTNVDEVQLCSSGNSVTPTDVVLPFDSLDFPERYEGMLVRLPQSLVISEYFNYDRFGEIVLALPLDGETRPFSPTAIDEPGMPAQARAFANSLRRITLDDTLNIQNPSVLRHPNGAPFSLDNLFRGGDLVANTVGVLSDRFGLYRVQPTASADYTAVNLRPASPEPVGGSLRVAAMNTLNFFITLDYPTGNPLDNKCSPEQDEECRGADADQPDEFARQRAKLIAAIAGLDADVVGLNELENTPGVDPLGDPTGGLVTGLNEMLGPGTYAYIDTGVIGSDTIRVGMIYKPTKVTPVGEYKILDSSVDPRFLDSKNRPVLAQTFEEVGTGERFTVAVNHLKSKGTDCNDVGDPDVGDGQGNCNQTRLAAAQALVDWLASDPTGSGDPDYLIMGDLNSYAKEDPIDAILAGPDDIPGTLDDYTNLISKFQGPYAYSYVFDGQFGYLDHALASATMVHQVTGAADWHINADEADVIDYDTSFKPDAVDAIYAPDAYRASDHDPVVIGLQLSHFDFSGFFQPVDNLPVFNIVNAGRTIPIKFSLNGFQGLDILAAGYPKSEPIACDSQGVVDGIEETINPGGSALSYDPVKDMYVFAWKTDRSWAGTCRQFILVLSDGSVHRANFMFR